MLVDPDEPKKKPNKDKTGNNKAEVGDKVTFSSGRYYEASDGSGASGNMYLGKKVKITRINKGSKYPYAIDATDGTELGWVKLNQLKGYASGIMRVPNDQLAWTQEQGEEAIVRNDGSILTPLSRDVSVLNADMTKNLWDFMGNADIKKFGDTLKPLPHIHPHLLRHTACSRMAEAGIDPRTLQDIMGHASMRMTMELYNHVTDERLMNEIQKLNDRRIS